MNEIHMLHGCAPSWSPHLQSLRNYVSEKSLKRYLHARGSAYGSIASTSNCDILTVDDATVGAARACVLAREAGHQITIFVNPAQIARRRSYWFSRLDAIMDRRAVASVTFEGQEFDLTQPPSLRVLRLAVKGRLMGMNEAATDALLSGLAAALKVEETVVPEHAQTLSLEALQDLADRGVHIENHGWDHRDPATLNPDELVKDIRCALDWFQTRLGTRPTHYAVPYGLSPLPDQTAQEIPGMILLANAKFGMGHLGGKHWNRQDITRSLQQVVIE